MLNSLLVSLQCIADKGDYLQDFDCYVAQVAHDDLLDEPNEYINTHSTVLLALQHAKHFVRDLAYDDEMLYTLMCIYTKASNSEAYSYILTKYAYFLEKNAEE